MYAAYFGLRETPFALTPDPGYLYLSPGHREALAHLLYGLGEDGGFVQLTGEIGTGKTTLIRALLAQCPVNVDTALCLNPRLTVNEFVATLCDELNVGYPSAPSLKQLVDALSRHLLLSHACGRQTVVVIDEAQNLSVEVLEQIRLLTNLETHRHKLLRMILVGQPELRHQLARPELRQLAQRITARYHLRRLDLRHSNAYLQHRLRTAGSRLELFSPLARRLLHHYAGGLPRLLNIIADRALLGAYSRDRQRVSAPIVWRAAREVLARPIRWRRALGWIGALGLLLATVGGASDGPQLIKNFTTAPAQVQAVITPPPPVAKTTVDASMNATAAPPSMAHQALPGPAASTGPGDPIALLRQLPTSGGWRDLLRLWGLPGTLARRANPCHAVKHRGLLCLRAHTDWAMLRRFDRPALLELNGEALGDQHRVLLRALSAKQATLEYGSRSIQLSTARLRTLWNGTLLLLWRPATDSRLLRPGSHGPAVRWLRQRLHLPGPSHFDQALEHRVRQFQRRHDLAVDGLVGPRTMLLLNNIAPAPATPLLQPRSNDTA